MDLEAKLERLSPGGEHCFFGYYDLPAWSGRGDRHLVHRVGFIDQMPGPEDVAEVGFLEAGSTEFHKIGETTAWNFQQGAMLQWHPAAPDDQVIYNRREDGRYVGVVQDLAGKIVRRLSRPVANVDPRGRFALSIGFERMFDFRPGYGYAGIADPFAGEAHPTGDGVFRIDLESGKSELVLSLRVLGEFCRPYFGENKILVNHLNLNPGGTRFVALVRNWGWQSQGSADTQAAPIGTLAVTANADGSDPFILWDGGVASHYHWRDDEVLAMVIKDPKGRITLGEFRDRTREYRLVDPDFFVDDGHESYSPDLRRLVYDSYPREGRRHLYLYDLESKRGVDFGSVKSRELDDPVIRETRCDLHPRWHPTGKALSIDSVHEGFRGIYRFSIPKE